MLFLKFLPSRGTLEDHSPHSNGGVPGGAPREAAQADPGGDEDPVNILQEFVILDRAQGRNPVHQVLFNVMGNNDEKNIGDSARGKGKNISIPR